MTALGVMGGTFDPIHHGHLVAASEAAHEFGLDRVVFVPAGRPWQKHSRRVAEAEARYLMTVLATAIDDRFTVSRVDIDRPGPTYTVDTLRELREQSPAGTQVYFITGADALAQILTWRGPTEILELADVVGVTRPGHPLHHDHPLPRERVHLLEIPALAISSTDIRARVASGRPIRYLVPDSVERFVAKSGLYREPE